MTGLERLQFIEALCNKVRDDVILKTVFMPEDWEGWEFREYIAKQFDKTRLTVDHKGKRYKNFQNEILVNGAL